MSSALTVASGAAFGAALIAAGVYQPSVIIAQLKFTNWHMIQAFLTATATSSVIYAALSRLNYITLKPRSPTSLGLIVPYDGNVLGGAVLGAGMALSGACPGTVLAQVASGVSSGAYALFGAALGGIVWMGGLGDYIASLKKRAAAAPTPTTNGQANGSATPEKKEKHAIYDVLGISYAATEIGFLLVNAAIVAATIQLGPASKSPSPITPVQGGLLIGLAQLVSLLLRRSMVGVSTSYEELGRLFWDFVSGGSGDAKAQPASHKNMLFAGGVLAGAGLLARLVPALTEAAAEPVEVAPGVAALGGLLIVLGARTAGGCPSGHGISGVSLLSVASVITIASAFIGGGIVAPLMY